MTTIYENLYQAAASYMKEAGEEPECSKSVFLHLIGTPPAEADISKILDLKQREFEDAAFLLCIHRMPKKNEREYAIKDCLSEESFQKKVLQNITKVPAFAGAKVKMINNPYFKSGKAGKGLHSAIGNAVESPRIRAIFRKLPKWMQKKLRRKYQ